MTNKADNFNPDRLIDSPRTLGEVYTNEKAKADNEELLPRMDWDQVALLDGAAPCFFIEGTEFCGRAESYPGHGNSFFHDYVSLEQFINTRTRLSDEAAESKATALYRAWLATWPAGAKELPPCRESRLG